MEKIYQGVRSGDAWIAKGPITMVQAENLVSERLHGSKDVNFSLEEEGDHLNARIDDRDTPESGSSPGNNHFEKAQVWGSVGPARSRKRTEFPNP
jgi:hypothetical protein